MGEARPGLSRKQKAMYPFGQRDSFEFEIPATQVVKSHSPLFAQGDCRKTSSHTLHLRLLFELY